MLAVLCALLIPIAVTLEFMRRYGVGEAEPLVGTQ